ncbi:MAG: Uma2 family endonuclease [Gemmatales bacterium]
MGRILSHTSAKRSTQPIRNGKLPLLYDGQRLDRETFHRLYEASPELKRVQLIEGIVHMPSPMRFVQHANPQTCINGWLFCYSSQTPGVRNGGSATLKIDTENEFEPDGMLFYDQGQLVIADDGYLEGVPELVVEVSASTISVDSKEKFRVYEKQGVKEYLLWNTQADTITWFARNKNKFVAMKPNRAGIIQSKTFPGLWLDVAAMLEGDLTQVMKTLNEGLTSGPHVKYVKRFERD